MHVFIILRSSCSIYLGMLSLTNMGIAVIFDTCTLPAEVHIGPCTLYTTCRVHNGPWTLCTTCRSTQWSLYTVHYLQSTQWSLYTVHYLQKYTMVPVNCTLPAEIHNGPCTLYTTCRSTQWSLYTGTSWFFPWGNCFVHVLIIWLLISF